MGRPDFRPIFSQTIVLNNFEKFWVQIGATHLRLRKGRVDFWALIDGESSDWHRSSHNATFVKIQGNVFSLPSYALGISGYVYLPIKWVWLCRKCHNEVPKEVLDEREH